MGDSIITVTGCMKRMEYSEVYTRGQKSVWLKDHCTLSISNTGLRWTRCISHSLLQST